MARWAGEDRAHGQDLDRFQPSVATQRGPRLACAAVCRHRGLRCGYALEPLPMLGRLGTQANQRLRRRLLRQGRPQPSSTRSSCVAGDGHEAGNALGPHVVYSRPGTRMAAGWATDERCTSDSADNVCVSPDVIALIRSTAAMGSQSAIRQDHGPVQHPIIAHPFPPLYDCSLTWRGADARICHPV